MASLEADASSHVSDSLHGYAAPLNRGFAVLRWRGCD